MKPTPKEAIVLILACLVFIVIVIPVIGSTVGTIIHGEPISRPEFLKTVGDIVIYILGILSGYVLNQTQPKE